jgi:hypothetical protein
MRSLAPLPREKLLALKRSVSELGSMVGRHLNQVARAANPGDRVVGPVREDLRVMHDGRAVSGSSRYFSSVFRPLLLAWPVLNS